MKLKKQLLVLPIVLAMALGSDYAFANNMHETKEYQNQETEEIILATSGDNIIPLTDFLYYFGEMKSQQEMFLQMFGFSEQQILEFWTDDSLAITQEDFIKDLALQNAIYNATILSLAIDAGCTYDSDTLKEIEKNIDEFVINLTTPETKGEDVFYNMFMITPEDYKNIQKNQLIIEAFASEIRDSIHISEEELLEYYNENREFVDYSLNMEATAIHILIESNDTMTDEERASATERANELFLRVEQGEDITQLAVMYSEDPAVVFNNGKYVFYRGEMIPEFENWAFSAQPGDIGMIETVFGYHIMYSVSIDSIEERKLDLEILVKEEFVFDIIMDKIYESDMLWVIDEQVLDNVTVL